ncbi:MAG: hypothetical protein ACE366_11085 [Bradymonadia bacterium]
MRNFKMSVWWMAVWSMLGCEAERARNIGSEVQAFGEDAGQDAGVFVTDVHLELSDAEVAPSRDAVVERSPEGLVSGPLFLRVCPTHIGAALNA